MDLEKQYIRKKVLEQRKALSEADVTEKSSRILQGLSLLHSFQQSRLVMAYMDFRNEVMTAGIIAYCLSRGKRVVLPYCIQLTQGACSLEIYEIRDISRDVRIGTYGILEPDREKTRRLTAEVVEFVLVPGVAFDEKGFRIGYGAGYYDRFLESVPPHCVKAGLAFDLQVLPEVPAEDHDRRMDVVITESRIIY